MKSVLIRNGNIVTMNKERGIIKGDLLIEGNRIKQIAPEIPYVADEVIEAEGCAVIPGLIQTHIHLTQTLFRGLADDLELLDWLKKRIWPLEAAHTYESNHISALLGISELISGGTTSLIDMGTVNHTDAVFEAVKGAGIRFMGGKCMMDHGNDVPDGLMEDTAESVAESVKLAEKWHGSEGGRIEYAFAPRFVVSCTEELLLKVQDIARDMNLKVHTHASENRGEIAIVEKERGMRNIQYLQQLGLTGENLILAHCIWLDEEEKRILADSGTMVSHCPSSNLNLASGISPVQELLEMGCNVSISADGAPCSNNLDMFTEMRHATLKQKISRMDSTALPALQVFEMATLGGAKALGKSDELGSLEEGKLADVAVVNLNTVHNAPNFGRDIVSQLVYSVRASDVLHTIVNGRILMRDRKLTSIDTAQVLSSAEKVSEDCMKVIGSL
ncbi:5'-deoxyadenosine deaminase [Limisalsivibrio acetivorans]|uniref:5'-deoxyadenosine deaminase n=1 Tax=Limisalsivibrio acetivorans TaxID=1304888 RepID=UPI0003B719D6|nr:5'-deoxyadenosine deaminase [Limisalsivibrio acetivorans]